jgi:hypothetical protein
LVEKCCDLAASNMSTNLRVLKCCCEPGGVCDKRTGRPSLEKEEKFEDQSSFQSPQKSLSRISDQTVCLIEAHEGLLQISA